MVLSEAFRECSDYARHELRRSDKTWVELLSDEFQERCRRTRIPGLPRRTRDRLVRVRLAAASFSPPAVAPWFGYSAAPSASGLLAEALPARGGVLLRPRRAAPGPPAGPGTGGGGARRLGAACPGGTAGERDVFHLDAAGFALTLPTAPAWERKEAARTGPPRGAPGRAANVERFCLPACPPERSRIEPPWKEVNYHGSPQRSYAVLED